MPLRNINLRQFRRDVRRSSDGRIVFPLITVTDGIVDGTLKYDGQTDIQAQITSNTTNLASTTVVANSNESKLTTLLDSGTALDTISELQAAWDAGDATLTGAVTALTSTAATDRALIRTQFQAVDAALSGSIDDVDALVQVHAGLHTSHTNDLATKASSHQAVFTGNVTINSTSIVGDSGTEIKFNQTNAAQYARQWIAFRDGVQSHGYGDNTGE